MNFSIQQLDRIDARIEQGFYLVLIATVAVCIASGLSIYRNWKR